ncbi:MAG: diacylglycerol/polyprenol kinase family protein [Bacteroidia bacterium]
MGELLQFIWLSLAGVALVSLAEWMYYHKNVHVEVTRTVVHIGAGLLALFLPVYFQNQWWVLLICGLVQLILVVSNNRGYLKSISAVKRKTYGGFVYPMVIYMVYMAWYYSGSRHDQIVQSYAYFHLPVLILTLCDPLATLIGRLYPIIKFNTLHKSIGGTIAFWVLAFLLSCFILLYSHLFNTKDITWVAIFIATVASLTELYSKKGLDNLFVPIAVLLAMYVVEYFF